MIIGLETLMMMSTFMQLLNIFQSVISNILSRKKRALNSQVEWIIPKSMV